MSFFGSRQLNRVRWPPLSRLAILTASSAAHRPGPATLPTARVPHRPSPPSLGPAPNPAHRPVHPHRPDPSSLGAARLAFRSFIVHSPSWSSSGSRRTRGRSMLSGS